MRFLRRREAGAATPAAETPGGVENAPSARSTAGEWYAERGTCPRCRSGNVTHMAYGFMPPRNPPSWVRSAGCMVGPEGDRSCADCGMHWDSNDDGTGMRVRDWEDLVLVSRARDADELARWLGDRSSATIRVTVPPLQWPVEQDLERLTHVRRSLAPAPLLVHADHRVVQFSFPFSLEDLTYDLGMLERRGPTRIALPYVHPVELLTETPSSDGLPEHMPADRDWSEGTSPAERGDRVWRVDGQGRAVASPGNSGNWGTAAPPERVWDAWTQ